jgi:hypothetical protein
MAMRIPSTLNQMDSAIARVALECSLAEDALQEVDGKHIDRELYEKLNQELDILAVDLGLLLFLVPRGAPVLIESIFKLGRRAEALRNVA